VAKKKRARGREGAAFSDPPPDEEPPFCPNCSHPLTLLDVYCPACGTLLSAREEE